MYPNQSMYALKNLKVKRLLIQETGTYNQQWKRPFASNMDVNTFNTIVENVHQARKITSSALTGVANQFIQPTATPESHILIPNGWNERRLRFFLEVETEHQIGATQTEYIVGYTNYAGLSEHGHLDPNMTFHINSVNTVRNSYMNTPLGNQVIQNVIDSSHVIVNDQYTGLTAPNKVFRLRPEDVFVQLESNELEQESGGDFTDTRLTVNREPIKSRRTNAIAPVYVASVLDSYLQTQRADHTESSQSSIFESAYHSIKSDSCSNDPFISYIRNKGDATGNSFSYNDLMVMDPATTHNTVVIKMTPAIRSTLHQTGATADWGGSNSETVFATCISQSTPGYMLDHGINKLHFIATNRDIGGKISIKVVNAKTLMHGIDPTAYVQSLIYKLETELLKDLSYNNQMDFILDVNCDLLGETWVNVSINNGPIITYVTPSFCDALMTPVTTNNRMNVQAIAGDFENLIGQIGDSSNVYGGLSPSGFGNV